MGDLSLSDAEIDFLSEIDPSQSTGHQKSKSESRRRGRPPGTFGGRIWRETQKNLVQQQEALKPKPGDIAFARQCRSKAAQQRRETKQQAVSSSAGQLVLPTASSVDDLAPYLPVAVLAPSSAKTLQLDLQNAFLKGCSKGVGCDDELTEQHLQGSMASLSYTAFEKLTGDNNAGRRVLSVASALFEFAVLLWSGFLLFLTGGGVKQEEDEFQPLMCCLRLRYDETPTKVRIEDLKCDTICLGFGSAPLSALTPEQVASGNFLGSETSSNYAKVLQIEMFLGVLLQNRGGNHQVWTFGQVPTCLYALESTTGRITYHALKDAIEAVGSYKNMSEKFPINIRHTCSDRYSANTVAERFLSGFYPDSTLCHLWCDVHRLYSVVKGSVSIAEKDVSGCLAFALGFGEPGTVPKMRTALAKILLRRLSVVHGDRPDGEVSQYRKAVFDMFLPLEKVSPSRRKLNRKRRFVLSYFLNGPYWEEAISHFCPFGCCSSAESSLKGVVVFASWALIPFRCPVYPRSRWTRADEAFDFVGLLCSVHNLLPALINELTGGPNKPEQEQATQQHQHGLLDVLDNKHQDLELDEWQTLMEQETGPRCGGFADPFVSSSSSSHHDRCSAEHPFQNQPDFLHPEQEETKNTQQAQGEEEPAPILSGADGPDWAQERKKNKKKARAWANSEPCSRLIVTKEVLGVLMHLMYKFLQYTGQTWDRKQKQLASVGKERSYRILLAYQGKDVLHCIDQLSALFFQRSLALTPSLCTFRIIAMRFKMIARALCHLHGLLRLPRNLVVFGPFGVTLFFFSLVRGEDAISSP